MSGAAHYITPQEKQIIGRAVKDPFPVLKYQIKNSLFFFIQYFWDCYTENKFVSNWHIKKLCGELEQVARRVADNEPKHHDLIINVPPGTTKTAMVSVMFPIWCWVNWYWMRFITTSHSNTLSLESAEYSRDIIRSDKFREMFPELDIRQDKDQKSNFKVVKHEPNPLGVARPPRIKQGGNRVSTSVGAKIIGFHAHIIIVDDLVDPKVGVSEATVWEANRYLDQTLSTRKVDKSVTPTIMIMQRLAQNDPTGHWLSKRKENVRHICLPGELRNYGQYLKPQEWRKYYVDDLLDPARMDWNALNDLLADLGQYGYAGQIGQNPVPAGGGMFKVDRFSTIEVMSSVEHYVSRIVRYWDKAGTAGDGAYTVGAKMARLTNGRFVLMDIRRGQWSSEVREDIIRQTAEADGRNCTIYIEQEPGSGGKESAENTIRNLAGFKAEADRPTGDKTYRADPYSVQVNQGNVQLLRGPWIKDYVDELEFFPNSTFKDQVDASAGAFNKLAGKREVKVWRR